MSIPCRRRASARRSAGLKAGRYTDVKCASRGGRYTENPLRLTGVVDLDGPPDLKATIALQQLYNAAIASALAGRWDVARELASTIQACAYGPPNFRDPVIALRTLAQSLLDAPDDLRSNLDAIVARSRAALKLPPRPA